MAFLKLPVSAESAATMSVFSPWSGSPASLFENPTGISSNSTYLMLSHNFWFADVSRDIIALSSPFLKGVWAGGTNFVRIPGIEVRETPTEDPLSTIEAQYFSMALGCSYGIIKKIRVGCAVKYIKESMYTETGYGAAVDLGAHWSAPSSLDLSLLIQNWGMMSELNEVSTPFPLMFKIGVARPDIFTEGPLSVSIGLNFGSNLTTTESIVQAGTKIAFREVLLARGGFERVGTVNRYALGFGLKVKRFQVDYAFLFMPEGLGYPHILTLTYRLGK